MTRRNFGFSFVPRSGFHGANAAAGEHHQSRSPQAPAAGSIQTARVGLSGGNLERPLSRHDAYNTRADSNLLSCGSLIDPGSSPFKRSYLLQALIDVVAIGSAILLVTSVALSIPLSLFLIFFCSF